MRYQVPQFIEMEDKLIGPLTLKQFLYLAAVPAVCYVLRFFVELPYIILVGVIFFPLAVLLAFYKVNGRPFIYAIKGLLRFIKRPHIYIWRRMPFISQRKPKEKQKPVSLFKKSKDKVKKQKKKKDKKKRDKQKKINHSPVSHPKDFESLAKTLDKGKRNSNF